MSWMILCSLEVQSLRIPFFLWFSSIQSLCRVRLCDPMNHSMPGLPVYHQLPEFTQTHVHWVGDAIQPSHSLRAGGEGDNNLSQHQGLFKWVSSWHQVAKVLEFQLQHQSFQWTPRTDLLAVQGTLKRQRCKLWCQNVDKESKNAFELKLLSASNRLLHFM